MGHDRRRQVRRPAFVERDAARFHDKYARIRLAGAPVVRHVLAARPHAGYSNLSAAYGYVAITPSISAEPLSFPLPYSDQRSAGPELSAVDDVTASTPGRRQPRRTPMNAVSELGSRIGAEVAASGPAVRANWRAMDRGSGRHLVRCALH